MSKMTRHEKVPRQKKKISHGYKHTFMLIRDTSRVGRLEKLILLYRIYRITLRYVVPVTAYYYMLHTILSKSVCQKALIALCVRTLSCNKFIYTAVPLLWNKFYLLIN